MSDELMIQPQVIQPQKKDNSALYATGAGLVGGAGGYYLANKFTGKITSHDDIIKDVKDQVDLKSKYANAEEASIKGLTDAAKEVKDAEAALEAAKKPELPDTAKEFTEFNDAKNAYDNAYKKAYDEELAKHKPSGKATAAKYDFAKININPNEGKYEIAAGASDEEIKAANDELYNALHDKGVRGKSKGGSLAEQFRRDFAELTAAKQEVETQLGIIRNNRNLGVADYDTKLIKLIDPSSRTTILENLTDAQFDELLTKTEDVGGGKLKKIFRPDRLGKLAKQIAEDEIQPLSTTATSFEESVLKELGAKEGNAPAGGKYSTFTVERVASNGEKYDVTFHMKKGEFESAVKKYNKNLDKLRKERAGQIVHGFRQRVAEAGKNRNFTTEVVNTIRGNSNGKFGESVIRILESEGLITRDAAGKINRFDAATVSTWADDEFATTLRSGTESEKEVARAKNSLRKLYNHELKKAEKRLTSAYSGVPAFETFDRQVAEAYTKNERLAKINKVFEEKYKGVVEGGNPLIETAAKEASTEISAEAKDKAKEYAEKQTEGLKKTMEEKAGLLEEAKKTKGTANEEAVKKAQEVLNGKQSEFESKAKAFAEKLPKAGGMNKWLGAGIGLVALGLAGYMAGKPSD